MKTKTITLYSIDELTPDIKEKVLEKYRYINVESISWYDFVYEEFIDELEKEGYEKIDINFSGFCSQGDGASFTARLDLCVWLEVHGLKDTYRKAYDYAQEYGETDIIEIIRGSDNHYYHEHTTWAYLTGCDPNLFDSEKYDNDANDAIMKELNAICELIEDERLEQSKMLYSNLRQQYEYLTEDEQVIETLRINEYQYMEDGRPF